MFHSVSRFFVLTAISSIFLVACSPFPALHIEGLDIPDDPSTQLISSDATRKTGFTKNAESLQKFCLQTNADLGVTQSESLSLGDKLGDTIGAGENQAEISLGGRDPEVLIIREVLYRSCETTLNSNLNAHDSLKVYGVTLEAIIMAMVVQTLLLLVPHIHLMLVLKII